MSRWRPRRIWREIGADDCLRPTKVYKVTVAFPQVYESKMNTEPTSHRNGFPICPTTASDTMATSYTPTIGAQTAASSPLKSGTKCSAWTPSTGRDPCKRQRSSQSGSVPKRQLPPSTESRPQTTNLRRTSTDVSSSRSTETADQLLLNDISEEDVSSHRTHGRPRDYDSVEDDGIKVNFFRSPYIALPDRLLGFLQRVAV